MSYALFWIIMIIILTVLEAISVNLTTIWFVASGIVSLIISFFNDSLILQFGVFVVLGVILLVTTRPLLKKLLKVDPIKTNLDRVIGMKGVVTSKIEPLTIGEVKVDGKKWSAISDETIDIDDTVEVLKIDGVKLIVKKAEE